MEDCEICGKTFKDKRGLSGHMQLSHPGNQPIASCELAQLKQQINALAAKLESSLGSAFSAKNTNTGGENMGDEFVTKKDLEIAKLKEELAAAKTGGVAVAEVEGAVVTKKDLEIERLRADVERANAKALEVPSVDDFVEHCRGCTEHEKQLRRFIAQVMDSMSPDEVRAQMKRVKIEEAPKSIILKGFGEASVGSDRQATGKVEKVYCSDGKKHSFRAYKSADGLAKPFVAVNDVFLGNTYVDLAQPLD
jgi:hypothetical protein